MSDSSLACMIGPAVLILFIMAFRVRAKIGRLKDHLETSTKRWTASCSEFEARIEALEKALMLAQQAKASEAAPVAQSEVSTEVQTEAEPIVTSIDQPTEPLVSSVAAEPKLESPLETEAPIAAAVASRIESAEPVITTVVVVPASVEAEAAVAVEGASSSKPPPQRSMQIQPFQEPGALAPIERHIVRDEPTKNDAEAESEGKTIPLPREGMGPDVLDRVLLWLKRWFTEGNVPVKIGMLVLFAGVAGLLKLAADEGWLDAYAPIWLRLSVLAAAAFGGLVFGWRKRESHRSFALSVQGGMIGLLLFITFAAVKLYDLLPVEAAFCLSVALVAVAAMLSVAQDALALAIFALLAGFLAPIWLSSGGGQHVVLFAYYVLLNVGILAIAWKRAWRSLNLLGFFFTFTIGMAWGIRDYEWSKFASVQPFLAIFFLFYLAIPLLYAWRVSAQKHRAIDGILVFGLPVWAFALEACIVDGRALTLSFCALGIGLLYAALAWVLRRREGFELLGKSYAHLAVAFGTLAIPLGFDVRVTTCLFALEGVALVWLGLRQKKRLPQVSGTLLQLASLTAYFLADWGVAGAAGRAIANGRFSSAFILCACAFAIAWLYRACRSNGRATAFYLLGLGWWLLAAVNEIVAFVNQPVGALLAFAALTSWIAVAVDWRWPAKALNLTVFLTPIAAVIAFPFGWYDLTPDWPILNLEFGAALLLSGVALASAWRHQSRQSNKWATAFYLLGLAWWLGTGISELDTYLPRPWMTGAMLCFGALTSWMVFAVDRRRPAKALSLTLLLLPGLLLFGVARHWIEALVEQDGLHLELAGGLLLSAVTFASAWQHRARQSKAMATALYLVGIGWWLSIGIHEIAMFVESDAGFASALIAFVALTAWMAAEVEQRRPAKALSVTASLALVVPALIAIFLIVARVRLSLGWNALAWGAFAVLGARTLLCLRPRGDGAAQLARFAWWPSWALILSLLAYWFGDHLAESWRLGLVALPTLALTVLGIWQWRWLAKPMGEHFDRLRTPLMLTCWSAMGLGWIVALFASGSMAPLPWLPLVNPMELLQFTALALFLFWLRKDEGAASVRVDHRHNVFVALLDIAFVTAVALRCVHHWADDVAWDLEGLWKSSVAQMSLTIVWSVWGALKWVLGSRRKDRGQWTLGAILAAAVVVKLLLVDRHHLSTVAGVVSFILVGLLFIAVGYVAPRPMAVTEPPDRPKASDEMGELKEADIDRETSN
ncbi:MAG: DUF2339 domain-containing protein [Myxococcales bacterium]|nr:DUF2339 domain-containing protein [Myxococcales bacterium]